MLVVPEHACGVYIGFVGPAQTTFGPFAVSIPGVGCGVLT